MATEPRAGSVIELQDGDAPSLGVVLEAGKSLKVLREGGKVAQASLKAVSSDELDRWDVGAGQATLLARLTALAQKLAARVEAAKLSEAWELLHEDGGELSPLDLADLLWGEAGPLERVALARALRREPMYFEARKELYRPRNEKQVAELRRQHEAEQAAQALRRRFVEWARGILALGNKPASLPERRRLLAEGMVDPELRARVLLIEEYALLGDEFERIKQAESLLELLEAELHLSLPGKLSARAYKMLVLLGRWLPHENIPLRKASLSFEPDVAWEEQGRAWAAQLQPPASSEGRLDLRDVQVWTVDAASTLDIDDGLSARRREGGGWEVGIHIADPADCVPKNHALDEAAREKGTSVYLPEGTIPMFPRALSEGAMSLLPGEPRPALSFLVDLDDDLVVLSSRIALSLVRSSGRLTYEEAEAAIQGELPHEAAAALKVLHAVARKRAEQRLAQGAVMFQIPDPKIGVVWEDRALGVVERVEVTQQPELASNDLVQEMMVWAGELAGRFCEERGLPVVYRIQPSPDDPEREEKLKGRRLPLLESFQGRRWMRRGGLATAPSRHFGLGIERYVQATSPIRRYADLLCHRQIRASLRGEPLPYTEEEVGQIASWLDERSGEAAALERDARRYWTLVYLAEKRGELVEALVVESLDEEKGRVNLFLEEVALSHPTALRRKAAVGERVSVKLDTVDARRDTLVVRAE
jgi:exoribonuclease-2